MLVNASIERYSDSEIGIGFSNMSAPDSFFDAELAFVGRFVNRQILGAGIKNEATIRMFHWAAVAIFFPDDPVQSLLDSARTATQPGANPEHPVLVSYRGTAKRRFTANFRYTPGKHDILFLRPHGLNFYRGTQQFITRTYTYLLYYLSLLHSENPVHRA